MVERGIDLLLLVALQVRVERTSFLPKFLITSSFRATPFLTVTVLLLTSLSSLYQDTVGVGLPATMEKKKKDHVSTPNFQTISFSQFRILRPRIFLSRDSLFWKDPLIAMTSPPPSPRFLLSPTISGRVETYGLFVRSFHHRSFKPPSSYDGFYEEKSRLYREVRLRMRDGELEWIATIWYFKHVYYFTWILCYRDRYYTNSLSIFIRNCNYYHHKY